MAVKLLQAYSLLKDGSRKQGSRVGKPVGIAKLRGFRISINLKKRIFSV